MDATKNMCLIATVIKRTASYNRGRLSVPMSSLDTFNLVSPPHRFHFAEPPEYNAMVESMGFAFDVEALGIVV
jgi:hypothetical protein